jgi:TP901 family phage tail tape measure protein
MADVNANIGVNIDTSAALAQLKALQRQISQFHTSIAKSSETATLAQRDLQKNFLNSVNAIGAFSAELRTVKTTSESFTDSLQKNKFSMREYFRFAGGATKTFGKLFKSEFDTIGKVADDRVKRLQTQYIKLGRDTSGVMKAIAIMPNQLDMSNFSTQTQIAAQKQAIFNQLVKQGSTNLLNFGKNTQWAGRQLMVGFTLPLATLGTVATRTFMEMEAQTIKFRKVYGDLFTPTEETTQALDNITALGQMFTQYGIAVSQTVGLAAEAAAAGFSGVDLQRQTTEATRLSILGQVDAQKALETTISLQNAFRMSSDQLASSIDFLNAVENQTVVSLDDITTAIPKVAPVIEQLGGDVKDLAFFMAAMKEGGINASEGANALKSGLAALINPTEKASAMLAGYGINIKKIIEGNQGDLKTTVVEFAQALDTLDPLTRARAIEQLFGKFQFARLSTLFTNVINETGQASRVLDLAGTSIEDLAALSESELGMTADSAMNKFKKSVEDLKFALVPVGQTFMQAITPIVEFLGGILERFNNLSDGVKKAIVVLTVAIGAIGPIALMTFGLLANGLANIVKGAMVLRNGYLRLTGQTQILGEQTEYLTMEQIDATAASHSLDQSHARLTQTFTAESSAVTQLIAAYQQATAAAAKFAAINPGMMRAPGAPTKRAKGKPVVVGGSGNQDTELALLTPGETVIPADMSKQYGALINGMIAGNIPGYQQGRGIKGFKNATIYLQEQVNTAMGGSGRGASMSDVLGSLKQSGGAAAAPLLAVIANDIKKGLNNPNNYKEYSTIGDTLINAAVNALESSGKEFVKDLDLEEIVVPAMKEAATGLSVAGVEIKDALERAIEQIRTVAPIGVASGAAGGQGRTNLPGSYRATGKTAQEFAMKKNADVFARQTVQSQSRGTKQVFKMRDVDSEKYVTATMAHIMPSINASVSEIESKISAYVPQAAKRLEKLGEQAGKKIGKSTVDGVAIGAKTASPSKDTIKTGQDIGRGLEIGMDSMQDDVAMSGQELGSAAVGGTQSGARQRRSASRPQGAPGAIGLSGAASSAVSPAIKNAIDTEVKARKTSAQRIDSMNKGLMAGTFALTSLAGAGSMAGGTIGNLSQHVMKFSGLLFALMSVTQLLTQAKFAQLIATRATTVATAMGGTGFKSLFSSGGGLVGFGKNLLTAGKFLLRFAGPIGLATTAMIGTISVIKMVNAARERERVAIEGLADAMTTTTEQVKTLGDFFNVVPTKLPFELGQKEIVAPEVRSQRETLKADPGFQKEFKSTIESLRKATNDEAKIVFSSLALSLKAQGFASDQVQVIVDALREESEQTDVVLDVKSLTLSKESLSQIKKDITPILDNLNKALNDGMTSKSIVNVRGDFIQWIELSKEAQKQLATTSTFISETAKSAAGLFQLGIIDGAAYEETLNTILQTTNDLDEAQRKLLLSKVFQQLGIQVDKYSDALFTARQEMQLLALLSAGVLTKDSPILKALASTDYKTQMRGVSGLNKLYDKMFSSLEKIAKEEKKVGTVGGDTGGNKKEDTPFELAIKQLQNQQAELKNTTTAYKILTDAGFDAATALEYSKDSVIALGLATGKITTKQLEQVKTLMTDIEQKASSAAIRDFLVALQDDNTLKESFSGIIPSLLTMGFTFEEIEGILDNPTLMQAFVDKTTTAAQRTERMKKYLDEIRRGGEIDININLQTPEGIQKEFDKRKAIAMEYYDVLEREIEDRFEQPIRDAEKAASDAADNVKKIQDEIDGLQNTISTKQRDIEIQINRPIEELQQSINDLQRKIEMEFDRPLGLLQDESSRLSEDLTIMDKAAEAINSKYDAQAAALEKISEINQDIIGQQKQQISLADALTQGDISAAANAAQEMRASRAEAASRGAGNIIQAAREAELGAQRSPGGLTRDQIAQRQYQIERQSYTLSTQRKVIEDQIVVNQDKIYELEQRRIPLLADIRDIEDNIVLIQNGRLATEQAALAAKEATLEATKKELQAQLDTIDAQRERWEDAQLAIDMAKVKGKEFQDQLVASEKVAKGIADQWNSIQSKDIVLRITEIRTVIINEVKGTTVTKAFGGKIKKMATGGFVPGTGLIDKVPALLTPGEFVINKESAKTFGPLLNKINDSKFPSFLNDGYSQNKYDVEPSLVISAPSKTSVNTISDNSNTVYNYSVGITVGGSSATPDTIAKAVLGEIKYIDSQRIRGQR